MDEFSSSPSSHATSNPNYVNAEEKLRASEERYHSLFSNMMDGFAYCRMIFDHEDKPVDFVYLEVNDAFERITGMKRELVLGKKVTQTIPGIKEANPELFEIYGRVALSCREEKFEIFFKPLSLWLSVSVYCPQKGYFAAVFEDITKRKQSQEALQESEKRLNRSQEIAHLGSWELDLKNNQLTWSDEAYRIFGLKPQEFGATYEAFLNAVHPDDRAAVHAAYSGSLREGRDTYEIEHRVVRKGTGEVRFVYEKCEHFRDESGKITHSVGMVHDTTERKGIQTKLEENACLLEQYATQMEELANERAKQLKENMRLVAIGQTAGMVGHDIRNPLQAIVGELYMVREEVFSMPSGEAKKNIQESIACIEENLFYIDKIVADLQDYTKPLKPNKEKINVEKAIEEALLIVAIPSNLQVNISIEKDYPMLVADFSMLKRALINLIQNAVQAMPIGGLLKINATYRANHAYINIEDTGEGIPEEIKDKLFTPLFTTKSKGQGFGLAVVKRLIEAQEGKITFESEKGKGTTFTIKLLLT
jgi:PAS domain S-box-containing protein